MRAVRSEGDGADDAVSLEDKVTLNLSISRRARMVLHAHQDFYRGRGTPLATASALVESLILRHLREITVEVAESP